MTLLIPILIMALAALGFAAYQRLRRIRALEGQLTLLSSRAQRPVADLLAQRQRQVTRSITQAKNQLTFRSRQLEEVASMLPRFSQQVARLEQDQQLHQEAATAQRSLIDWITKLEGNPQESELYELKLVAHNALRLTTALIEEGDLPQARDTAVNAGGLLKNQFESLQATLLRIGEIRERIYPPLEDARACNAAILVRAPWQRTTDLLAEFERQEAGGRITDALITATRLAAELQQLTGELRVQLSKQADEKRQAAAVSLAEMLLWPPASEAERKRVRGLLEKLEAPEKPEGSTTLAEVRKRLELAEKLVTESSELARLHRKHWDEYVTELTARLRQSSLRELADMKSLPGDLVAEVVAVGRLRTRIEPRLGVVPGWQVADEVLEVIEREKRVLDAVRGLEAGFRARLAGQADGLGTFRRFAAGMELEPEVITALEADHRALSERLEAHDLGTLGPDLDRFDEALAARIDETRSRGLELARQTLEVMEQVFATLQEEGMLSLAGEAGRMLEQDLVALRRELQGDDVLAALKAAGTWAPVAPRLLTRVRLKRFEKWREERDALEAEVKATAERFPRPSIQKAAAKMRETLASRAEAARSGTVAPVPIDDIRAEHDRLRGAAIAQRERIHTSLKDLAARVLPSPELAGLPEESRERTVQELRELEARVDALRPALEQSDTAEEDLKAIGDDLNWVLLRVRKELAQRFLETYKQHQSMLERLGRGTVQFYLADTAHRVLQDARALQAECNPFLQEGGGAVELTDRLQQQLASLERLWRDALPRARRFYEKQVGMVEIELNAVTGGEGAVKDLPADIDTILAELRAELASIREGLQTDAWEAAVGRIEGVTERVRRLSDRAGHTRRLNSWFEGQRASIQELLTSLAAVGCVDEEKQLREAVGAWEGLVEKSARVEQLELQQTVLQAVQARAAKALQHAVEDVEKSRREQKEVERWRDVLARRKQDLDWIRSCLKDVMTAGADGLNLRDGLAILQTFQRALEPISLDLKAAEAQDFRFKDWLNRVRTRAELQFRKEFDDEIESLHEQPASMKILCAEVLTHIDSVLSSGQIDTKERTRFEHLQKRGDAYHRLFGKKFSFQEK